MPTIQDLNGYVAERNVDALEEAWIEATAAPDADWPALANVLAALTERGQGDLAEVLAFTALTVARESMSRADMFPFATTVLGLFDKNADVRREMAELFDHVFTDVPGSEALVAQSGLGDGSKSVKRALRVLETGLVLEAGAYLLERGGDHVVQVVEHTEDRSSFMLHTERGTQELDVERLAVDYHVVDPDDYRVLSLFRPDRLAELAENDPFALVVSVLRARGDRIDADELKFTLSPQHVSADQWARWWTRARNAIKKSAHVKVEGRSPAILAYEEKGHSLEDDARKAVEQATTGPALREAIENYFREVSHQSAKPDGVFVTWLAAALQDRAAAWRRGRPVEALCVSLVLAEHVPDEDTTLAKELLAAPDTVDAVREMLLALPDQRMLRAALEVLPPARPEDWADVYAHLLRRAPQTICERIYTALDDAGELDRLRAVVKDLLEDPRRGIHAFAWLWAKPARAAALGAPAPRQLLGQVFGVLAEVERSDTIGRQEANEIRAVLRAALGAENCATFRSVVVEVDAGVAGTFRAQIERLHGLGQSMCIRLVRVISDAHPSLFVAAKRVLPWDDESTLYTTEAGLAKVRAELHEIMAVKMKENAKAIGEAAAKGDLSENSEYKFALEERDLLQARAVRLSDQIERARVLSADFGPEDQVWIGSVVTLRAADDGTTQKLTILGPWDADLDQGIYNYQTPICRTLLGQQVGDEVTLPLGDREQRYVIETLDRAL